jgi:NTP pyrophosphatase (non-canonical NTP hydrolase)
MMKQLYFGRDLERGTKRNCEWLADEVKELGDALERNNIEDAGKEFADVLAWLASLANTVGIDLEKAALEKYDYLCPKCRHCPCRCEF